MMKLHFRSTDWKRRELAKSLGFCWKGELILGEIFSKQADKSHRPAGVNRNASVLLK